MEPIGSTKMASDFRGGDFQLLRPNGRATSRVRPVESGWRGAPRWANLRDSLTNRRMRSGAQNTYVRGGRVEVVGTRPRQKLLKNVRLEPISGLKLTK